MGSHTETSQFVHLHLHTEYSLLDGGNTIDRLIEHVKALGMTAVAVTDHGNLFGAAEFYRKATAAGIKPILGIEAYVAPGDRKNRQPGGVADGGFHLVLLAENQTGWRHLMELSSDAYLNGFYYKPRMDKTTLANWSEGLIAINGHLGSSLAHHLVQYVSTNNEDHYRAALEEARWHAETFGTNQRGEACFFVELQRNGVAEQERINPHLIRLARELDLPLVCDNDAHYLSSDDHDVHDSLCCISMGKTKDDPARLHYSPELYVKSPQQMGELFADLPEAIENTVAIAERCGVDLDFDSNHAPVVRVEHPGHPPHFEGDPDDVSRWHHDYCSQFKLLPYEADRDAELTPERLHADADAAIHDLCEAGLLWRYGHNGITDEIRRRLEWELKVLSDKRITAYFLIVWDFVNWARLQGIPALARGSGVGTMVGYVLGLSNACPIRYGLLFERFTDPDRSEYPDIDVDICQDGRAAVIDYVRGKYGHVAQIITFGRLKAKAAIKDVARVMGRPPAEGQRLANLVPAELNITLDAALKKEPDFRNEYENDPGVRQVVDTARSLEDHARHSGIHAAGVVIATRPLQHLVPLCKASGSDDVVTQWDGPTCERVGLLKMDFLGLRTLSTIELARQLIRSTLPEEAIRSAVGLGDEVPHPLDLDRLEYDDQKVLEVFRRGDTAGLFQFESGGMRKLLLEMQPDRLEDLIAANALFRPGPMDLIPEYCQRKHSRQAVPELHDIVDEHTCETYGIMVYQEQVMQILHHLGNIPLRRAYALIKAISKKKHDTIDSERSAFVQGAANRGLPEDRATELFELILKFAGYGFNKSHSTGYAILAYQTAHLKTYFPNQYMASVLTFESAARKTDDWVPYLQECRKARFPDHTEQNPHIGVEVKPPDINLSDADFSVVHQDDEPRDACHGHVRFGLAGIKGIGHGAIEKVVAERRTNGPFTSLFDLCDRIPSRVLNKAALVALVKSGCLDSLHGMDQRAACIASIDEAIAAGQASAEDRDNGQLNFLATADADVQTGPTPERPLRSAVSWDRVTMLAGEKESLGFHVSGHPLDEHQEVLGQYCNAQAASLEELSQDRAVVLGGVISRVRPTTAKTGRSAGQKMAMITLQDKTGPAEGVVFSDVFAECSQHVQLEAIVIVRGRVDLSRGNPQVIVAQVLPIHDAARHLAGRIELEFSDDRDVKQRMEMAAGLLRQAGAASQGNGSAERGRPAEVLVFLRTAGKRVQLQPRRIRAIAEPQLITRLREIVGTDRVRVVASSNPPRVGRSNGRRHHRSPAPAGAGMGS
jgi:DNA polymerase-3 subunit alpha